MEILQLNEFDILEVTTWKGKGVQAGFSTRKSGYSEQPFDSMNLGIHVNDREEDVLKNRQIFSERIGASLNDWKSLNQVHSNLIIDLSESHNEGGFNHHHPAIDADGMLTNHKGHVLTAFYADCVPLLFRDKNSHWIGVAHAGWKGTVHEIGTKMIEKFNEKDVDTSHLEVVIGPCISQMNYEVDQRVVDHIPSRYHQDVLKPTTEGHYLLDLKRLNFLYLVDNGVDVANIFTTKLCTYDEEDWLFSHRRDQGKTGRMMAYIFRD